MPVTRGGRRKSRPSPRNFYESALDVAERADLAAAAAEGLDDELALLRLLVRRELAAEPADLRLILQGLTLLVRTVAARHRLTPAETNDLEQRIVAAIGTLTTAIGGDEEETHG